MFLSIPKLSSKGLLNLHPIDGALLFYTRSPSQDRRDARSALKHLPKKQTRWPRGAIFTVGHSTLPIDRFITLIDSYGIERLADVRPVPRSRSVASEIRESVDAEPAIFTSVKHGSTLPAY